jgi:hypothetical protein
VEFVAKAFPSSPWPFSVAFPIAFGCGFDAPGAHNRDEGFLQFRICDRIPHKSLKLDQGGDPICFTARHLNSSLCSESRLPWSGDHLPEQWM